MRVTRSRTRSHSLNTELVQSNNNDLGLKIIDVRTISPTEFDDELNSPVSIELVSPIMIYLFQIYYFNNHYCFNKNKNNT